MSTLAKNIAQARSHANLSQADLAERVGLTQSAISRIEGEERQVEACEAYKIAQAVGVPVAELLEANPARQRLLAVHQARLSLALLSDEAQSAFLHEIVRRARESQVDDYSLVAEIREELGGEP